MVDFRFEAIPDGFPQTDADDTTQDVPSLSDSTSKNCLVPFRNLIYRLNQMSSSKVRTVTCIVSDGSMTFTLEVAEEFGIPELLFWTPSACGVLSCTQFPVLVKKGFTPHKVASHLTDGYLDTTVEWIPGIKSIRLKDLPSFIKTMDPNDIMLNYVQKQIEKISTGCALILNKFDSLEQDVLEALFAMFPRVYTVGPLQLLVDQITDVKLDHIDIGSNLCKEHSDCFEWLDSKEPNSVLYVNFGSIAEMTPCQLKELAWGLANSKKPFLWIIRLDVANDLRILPREFVTERKERGMVAAWCPQEQVLKHPSIGGFWSHTGWNSTIESVCIGVPLLCWPFFAQKNLYE